MAAPGLTMDETGRLGDRFETLDSPIVRIGLHLLEDLGGPGHNRMILRVTLICNARFGRKDPSSNAVVHVRRTE